MWEKIIFGCLTIMVLLQWHLNDIQAAKVERKNHVVAVMGV